MAMDYPEQFIEDVKLLAQLSENDSQTTLDILGKLEPSFEITSQIAELINDNNVSIDIDDIISAFRVAIFLYGLQTANSDLSDEEIIESINSSSDFDITPETTERLQGLLRLEDSLGLIAKIYDIYTEHQYIFRNSRIYTDLRPVFKLDTSEKPSAAVIIHNLKIEYNDSGKRKSIYIAMDGNDLRRLNDTISRAISKEKTIKLDCSELKIVTTDKQFQ